MVTDRDVEILKFIGLFGKTYDKVLAKTFFNTESFERRRIKKLNEMDLVSFWKTGLMSPRRAIVLTNQAREFLINEFDFKPTNAKLSITTIKHNIAEQIAYYHLKKIGQVIRTTVYSHGKKLNHVPDFILLTQDKKINIEVELTKKSAKRYIEILLKTKKDNVNYILYVLNKQSDIERFKNHLPRDDRLMFIDLESLINNIKNFNKINPVFQ